MSERLYKQGDVWSITANDILFSGLYNCVKPASIGPGFPLIICVHGGSYTSAYFDIPGYSLLARAAQMGLPTIAIDRPGYGQSTAFEPSNASIKANANRLESGIGEIWHQYNYGANGIFVIGHSIGAAVVLSMAADNPSWPLLGIAVSGIGLQSKSPAEGAGSPPPEGPPDPMIELPEPLKDIVMFGPVGTFASDTPAKLHTANAPMPIGEFIDIVEIWPTVVSNILSRVKVPVHYRQAQFDNLWVVDQEQVNSFNSQLCRSILVDGALVPDAGHCIDFHNKSLEFHQSQLEFAVAQSNADRLIIPPPY